ncbi:MAG: ATP-binding protein [Candidatus Eisenbacteria bacterium]|nr:ATP-binding protein [Candidatus Eisenbacteria bacterium]
MRLEHEIAASALASLLLGQPVDGLGDDVTPMRVAMQQEVYSPVDDIHVHGTFPGGERTLQIACRRRPTVGKSDESTVKLFTDYVKVVLDKRTAIDRGEIRLGLAVAGPYGPATELAVLTDTARLQPDRATFESAVAAPGAYSADIRARLTYVDELVAESLSRVLRPAGPTPDPKELSWVLLRALFVLQTQLEGNVAPGRTNVVARLQVLTGNTPRAEQLRLRLVEIASQAEIRAGSIDRPMLRRQLHSFGPLGPSPDFGLAKSQITLLESELNRRTQRSLAASAASGSFILDRSKQQAELVDCISKVPQSSVVLVRGEPDVGKSALALEAIAFIREAGGAAIAMSLRDLPPSALSLKSALGLAPVDLFAAAPSAPVSVLLLDGAEVIQESDAGAVGVLLDAASTTGMTTVLVARDDAAGSVLDLLRSRGHDIALEFSVAPLSDEEIATIVEAIPELARLGSDPRSAWLLRRLGLIELLLQATQRGTSLPGTLSSEAEVFATVWLSLIRQDGRSVGGIAPDDREIAAISVARQLLTGAPSVVTGPAPASLRSDGVLLSLDRSAAWQKSDRFASDVLRDFAAARLLLREGLQVLLGSTAPRWAIRATRLYSQARLSDAASRGEGAIAAAWAELRSEFRGLSLKHGARWGELPWEALLTAAWADRALSELTPQLLSDPDLQAEAIRCVKLRFSDAGACDPVVAAPLVSWLTNKAAALDRPRSYDKDPVVELVRSWLRGVGRREVLGKEIDNFRQLRSQLRDALLRRAVERSEEERIECLGLLGSEANEASTQALRSITEHHPESLHPIVESLDAAGLLAKQNVALLADLTEAYYVKKPHRSSRDSSWDDEGIRRHRGGDLYTPLAAWYRGPFLFLLRGDPERGIRMINRMLERGARRRVEVLQELSGHPRKNTPQDEKENGISLDLLGYGDRLYIGDPHVWCWYRGSSVGPYPCMSALFSVEMMLDELVKADLPARTLASWVLHDATTLASPGLIYGFLVRHIEQVTDELDGFLSVPEVWELEISRRVSEGQLHVQGADSPERVGRERRRWTPFEVAAKLVFDAAQRGDTKALERLRSIGERLLERAGGVSAPPHVRQWVAYLDRNSYSVEQQGDDIVLKVKFPEDVVQAMAPARTQSARVSEMFRLLNRYRPRHDTPYRYAPANPPDELELAKDIATAKELQAELVDQPLDTLRAALAGVAATVIQAASGSLVVPPESFRWAVPLLVECATRPHMDDLATEGTIFPDGADRKAALVLPRALEAVDQLDAAATGQVGSAITACATSFFLEVRQNAAEGLRHILQSPCKLISGGRCWHELAWAAIEAAARSVILGPQSANGRRQLGAITGDVITGLETSSERDLMLTHIAPAVICTIDAARVSSCISTRAAHLRDALLNAYARSACHWAKNNYDWRNEQHAAFAAAVLRWASGGNHSVIVEIAKRLRSSPLALGNFLHALTIVATYQASAVQPLAETWSQLMDLGLAVLRDRTLASDRHDVDELLQDLVPDPKPSAYVQNIDEVLKQAKAHWLSIEVVAAHIDEWLRHAFGRHWCIDPLLAFLQAQPVQQQANPGLKWIRRLVIGEGGIAQTSGFFLVGWLGELRDSHVLGTDTWPEYRAIVDGLVLGNFAGARDLQRGDE